MNILDIFPCEIWCEILNYLDKIIEYRIVCSDICKIIDTCEYINWKFRKILIKNSKILVRIFRIQNIKINDESIIEWIDIDHIKILDCDEYKKKINKNEIPDEIFNNYDNPVTSVEKIRNMIEFDRYGSKSEIYWRNKYNIDLKLPCKIVKLYCKKTNVVCDLSRFNVLKKLVCDYCEDIDFTKLPLSLMELSCKSTKVKDLKHLVILMKLNCKGCYDIDHSKLPENLIILNCSDIKENIQNINYLKDLKKLKCNGCYNIIDYGLPSNIEMLECKYTDIKDLSKLIQLEILDCTECKFINGKKLPLSLKYLTSKRCNIKNLDHLINLKVLNCPDCTKIRYNDLPNYLIYLDCRWTKINDFSKLQNLIHLKINKITKERYIHTINSNILLKNINLYIENDSYNLDDYDYDYDSSSDDGFNNDDNNYGNALD